MLENLWRKYLVGKKPLAHPTTLLIRFIMLENLWRKYLVMELKVEGISTETQKKNGLFKS